MKMLAHDLYYCCQYVLVLQRYFTQTLTAFAGSNFSCRRTATWAIALLLNNRDVPNKSRNEPDIQVGTNKQVNESGVKNLVYL